MREDQSNVRERDCQGPVRWKDEGSKGLHTVVLEQLSVVQLYTRTKGFQVAYELTKLVHDDLGVAYSFDAVHDDESLIRLVGTDFNDGLEVLTGRFEGPVRWFKGLALMFVVDDFLEPDAMYPLVVRWYGLGVNHVEGKARSQHCPVIGRLYHPSIGRQGKLSLESPSSSRWHSRLCLSVRRVLCRSPTLSVSSSINLLFHIND